MNIPNVMGAFEQHGAIRSPGHRRGMVPPGACRSGAQFDPAWVMLFRWMPGVGDAVGDSPPCWNSVIRTVLRVRTRTAIPLRAPSAAWRATAIATRGYRCWNITPEQDVAWNTDLDSQVCRPGGYRCPANAITRGAQPRWRNIAPGSRAQTPAGADAWVQVGAPLVDADSELG